MKKLILIGIGLACAGAFIGFDAVHAWVHKARSDVRAQLMSPEMELQAQISSAEELAERCAESVLHGKVALARLDSMIEERSRDLERRTKALERDEHVLRTRRTMLAEAQPVYLIGNERVSRRTLNRDALLRAKAYATDKEILGHLEQTLDELRAQRVQTAAEIEAASVEQVRLDEEIGALKAQLESLKARRAVAQTREESKYVFDRSAFDEAREKIAGIRATIAEQNKRLDFYGRRATGRKGLIPAEAEVAEENGVEAIDAVLDAERPTAEALPEYSVR